MGGGTYAQYRCVKADGCIVLPDGATPADGASLFVNPLSALGMVESMAAKVGPDSGPSGVGDSLRRDGPRGAPLTAAEVGAFGVAALSSRRYLAFVIANASPLAMTVGTCSCW
jgi:hypothetical protein